MKTFYQQVLILGGFYFIISFLFAFGSGIVFDVLNMAVFIIFLALFIVLCFKRTYIFLTRFQNQFAQISNYLLGLGIAQYFAIIFIIVPGIIYGYQAAQAQYKGLEIPEIPEIYLQIVGYAYWGILILSFVLVTYWNIKKKEETRNNF